MTKAHIEQLVSGADTAQAVRHVFCPYRVCPLGAHVDHQHGLVTGFALDKGISFDFIATEDGVVEVFSSDYDGSAVGSVHEAHERQYTWVDFIFGAVATLKKSYHIERGFRGIVRGSLPVGGLSSSASVILTYLMAFAEVNDIVLTPPELVQLAIDEERNYIGVNVGKLDQSCEVYCRKDNLLYLDTLSDSAKLIPISRKMPPFEIAVFFSGVGRKLAGSAYNMRVDECKAAAYALKDFARLEYGKFSDTYLRDVPQGIFDQHKGQLPPSWAKRAEHFYGENARVKKGVRAFMEGDIYTFGRLMFESGWSSIQLYQTGSAELKTLHEIMTQTDGIYGGRFSGAGFNGCAMALVAPDKTESIAKHVGDAYLTAFPHLEGQFSVHFCRTSDGIRL